MLPTKEELEAALSYDPDTGLFQRKKTGKPALNTVHPQGYRFGGVLGHRLLAHRVAWVMSFGEWPALIDHINRNRSDNRLMNRRIANRSQNAANTAARHSHISAYRGVAYLKSADRWTARFAGQYLGCFLTDIEAARAYDHAAKAAAVPADVLNFPHEP